MGQLTQSPWRSPSVRLAPAWLHASSIAYGVSPTRATITSNGGYSRRTIAPPSRRTRGRRPTSLNSVPHAEGRIDDPLVDVSAGQGESLDPSAVRAFAARGHARMAQRDAACRPPWSQVLLKGRNGAVPNLLLKGQAPGVSVQHLGHDSDSDQVLVRREGHAGDTDR